MPNFPTISNLAQPFSPVKSQLNTQLPLLTDSVIHHNLSGTRSNRIVYYKGIRECKSYGVSSSRRILSKALFLKKYDQVRHALEEVCHLAPGQREAALRLLRYWAYYGQVYVKEASVTVEPGCSKATYWRMVRSLKDRGLITVINRFIIRPHAQISNLYKFDRLLLLIARYLAEHGTQFAEKWLKPMLSLPGSQFWSQFRITGVEVKPGVPSSLPPD